MKKGKVKITLMGQLHTSCIFKDNGGMEEIPDTIPHLLTGHIILIWYISCRGTKVLYKFT